MQGNFNRDFLKLPGVEFVGMAIKDEGSRRHDVFCKVLTYKSRKETVIPTPSHRPVLTHVSKCRNGNLHNTFVPRQAYADRSDRPVGNPVPCPPHRKNA